MRILVILPLLVLGGITLAKGQPVLDPKLRPQFDRFFPSATTFSPKGGDPPHFKALAGPKSQDIVGYAFLTTEVSPLERGYGGPIVMLVGLDLKGAITGVIITDHHEPYGDFSIDRPNVVATFKGKDIRDPFRLGTDVDAVSRATITMSSAVRAIRNSASRVARELIAPPKP